MTGRGSENWKEWEGRMNLDVIKANGGGKKIFENKRKEKNVKVGKTKS